VQDVVVQGGVQRPVDGQSARGVDAADLLQGDIGHAVQIVARAAQGDLAGDLAAQVGNEGAQFDGAEVGLDHGGVGLS
jgi:hypothetical protein